MILSAQINSLLSGQLIKSAHFGAHALTVRLQLCDMTNLKKDQCAEIKFCVQSGCSRYETVYHIQLVHGANALSVWSIWHWFDAFQNGRVQVDDLAYLGQPVRCMPAKIQHVNTVIQQDWRQTVRQLAQCANLGVGVHVPCHQEGPQPEEEMCTLDTPLADSSTTPMPGQQIQSCTALPGKR